MSQGGVGGRVWRSEGGRAGHGMMGQVRGERLRAPSLSAQSVATEVHAGTGRDQPGVPTECTLPLRNSRNVYTTHQHASPCGPCPGQVYEKLIGPRGVCVKLMIVLGWLYVRAGGSSDGATPALRFCWHACSLVVAASPALRKISMYWICG